MRRFKQALSLLLSVVMMLGVFAVVPVAAAGAAKTTGSICKWVKCELADSNYHIYNCGELYDNIVFFLLYPDAVPADYTDADIAASDSVMNRTCALVQPYFQVQGAYMYVLGNEYDEAGTALAGEWDDYDFGDFPNIYLRAGTQITNTGDMWAFTWETDVALTEHPAAAVTETADGNILYYTDAQGRYFVFEKDDIYREVSPQSVVIDRRKTDTSYVGLSGESQDTRAFGVTEDTAAFNDDWYVVNQSLTVDGRIIVKGDANLILEDGKTLTAPKGICVNEGASLTIRAQSKGTGALVIDNVDKFNAGIGGDDRVDSGVITINGGDIHVTAGLYAAGIGGGYYGKGTVAINGGNIYADGQGSPSIGGGNFGYGSQVTLDWSNTSDSIFADSYSGTVTLKRAFFADGRILHNGEVSDLSSIDGRTITPHVHTFTHTMYHAGDENAAGTIEYWHCSVCGHYYSDEKGYQEIDPIRFVRHSLSLCGDIGVNFYIDLTAQEITQGARVDFSWLGQTDSVTITAANYAADQGLYKATCYVCAPEMTDDITAVLTIGGEAAETDHYSVKTYADRILGDDDQPEALKALVSAMLNYGGSTQLLFADEHPDNTKMANEDLSLPAALTAAELGAILTEKPDKSAINARLYGTGLTYCGYSLLLHSKTALRFYFKKESPDTDISGVRLSIGAGDDKVTYIAKEYCGGYAYVEVRDIPANELNNSCELSVNETTLGSYSVLTYVKDVLTDGSADETLTGAMTAMYRYHEAAAAYYPDN